ncbi:hypothetical protein [Bradyrhizobium sp.]|uniref:hypothetical protein n=1 Tax=Bradyrhizobium sp. TaxID=376 RepID=UPI003C780798
MARSGEYYWVFAHGAPSQDVHRKTAGFHSSHRVPDPRIVRDVIAPLHTELLREERSHRKGKDALAACSSGGNENRPLIAAHALRVHYR